MLIVIIVRLFGKVNLVGVYSLVHLNPGEEGGYIDMTVGGMFFHDNDYHYLCILR